VTTHRRASQLLAAILCFAVCLVPALLVAPSRAAVGQTESWGKFGFGAAAEFANPSMFGVDPSDGSVYVGDETEDHTAYRIQKLSPTGTVLGSATIPRYLDLPTPHLKKVGVWGVAVDASQHRFYVLEGGLQTAEESAGEWIAKRIRVFSTEPSAGKLVAPATGPSVITLPHTLSTDAETLYKPLAITVDPTSHDLLVMAEGGSPKRVVIQRFSSTSATGTSLGRFYDSANKLRPTARLPVGLAVAPSGPLYTVIGRPDKGFAEGKGNTRLFELPADLSSVGEVPGFATAFDAEEIPFGYVNKNIDTSTGSDQLSLAPDAKTIYWKEQVAGPEGTEPGNYLIRGYSLTGNATAQVYGGSSSLTTCRIAGTGAGFGVTGEGSGEKVVVLDTGPFATATDPGTSALTAPLYGDKVLTFGQNGSGCPVPVAKFKANGTEGNIKVAKGTTVNFDASPSVLTSGPANTPGFRRELIWKFGDGSEKVVTGVSGGEAALTTSHTYNTSGNFEATLQIHLKQPSYGNPALVSHKVEVESPSPEFQLEVVKEGAGTVTSSPSGINCGSECQADFSEGTLVKLTGTPDPGSKAVVWQICPGTVNGSNQCEVTISAAKEAKAAFGLEQHLLTVIPDGTGSGTVTSTPAGISCGSECQASFDHDAVVKLTGTPAAGSKAVVWQTCPGTVNAGNQCEVTIDAAKSATAKFDLEQHQLKVNKTGTGSGTVTSAPAGIDCGSECQANFTHGALVKLTATPAADTEPVAWTGCTAVNGAGECEVAISAAKEVTASFVRKTPLLTVTPGGSGSGHVTSNPAGIDCGVTCSKSFAFGTVVKLAAASDAGSKPVTWGGCEAIVGSNECEVTMEAAKNVTAAFARANRNSLTVERQGTGSGTVTSSPAGINCGSECSADYAEGTLVKLTGTPAAGSKAVVWQTCPGTVNGSNQCEVTMDAAKLAVAVFDAEQRQLKVAKNGTGTGTVTSSPAGISCGSECQANFNLGTVITLTGTSDPGSKAVVWESCPGTVNGSNQCEVTMSAAKEAKATFEATSSFQLVVTRNGSGSGTVTSSPSGINCGSECQLGFVEGAVVKLTGTPDPGSKAVVWQTCPGTVNGSNQCEVTISAAREAIATFDLEQHLLTVNTQGTGTGTVTSAPAGIDCGSGGSECQANYGHGTLVKLTGAPGAGSKPVVWASCPGTINAGNQCEVTVDAAKSATATFDVPGANTLSIATGGTGTGTVTSSPSGINCGSECSSPFAEGALVKLTGTADAGSKPVEWQTCPGTVNGSNQCEVTMSAAKEATAVFDLERPALEVSLEGSGSGTVTSAPVGIDCGGECETEFDLGSTVLLSGNPEAGSNPVVWRTCPGTVNASNQCVVAMDASKQAVAGFDLEAEKRILTVVKKGGGAGYVGSAPAGIGCGGTCTGSFALGSVVKLTGTAGAGVQAVTWSGCSAVSGGNKCEVVIGAANTVTATFTPIAQPPKAAPPAEPAPPAEAPKKKSAREKALEKCQRLKGKAKANCIRKANEIGKKKKKPKKGKKPGAKERGSSNGGRR
jgi:PKD domain/Divergent InlB B-repeat domain